MNKYRVEVVAPDVAGETTVTANDSYHAAFVAGAIVGASAVVMRENLRLLAELFGIRALQDQMEKTLQDTDIYVYDK